MNQQPIFCIPVCQVLGWGYRASDQRRWAVLHPACGGRQQSPIAITARQAIPISIPAMELIGYQNPLPGPLTVTNNGHSGRSSDSVCTRMQRFWVRFLFGSMLKI